MTCSVFVMTWIKGADTLICHFLPCSLTNTLTLCTFSHYPIWWRRRGCSGFGAPELIPLPCYHSQTFFFSSHCFSVAYIMASVLLKRILRGDSNNPDRQCCYISISRHSVFACQRPGALLIAFRALPLPCKQYLSPGEQVEAWSGVEGG